MIAISPLLAGCALLYKSDDHMQPQAYESLTFVYYKNTPAAPTVNDVERSEVTSILAKMDQQERDFLEDNYGNDLDLKAYALRDTDGDGFNDYRINGDGRFIENDTDADGDGVRNVLDENPYDRASTYIDTNANGVPDHIDWALMPEHQDYADLQASLFNDYDIIMVERNSAFTRELAQTNHDLIRYFYWPLLTGLSQQYSGTYPALKTLATETAADHRGDDGTLADMAGANASVTYYDSLKSENYIPIFLLQVVAHELMHAVEFSLDTRCRFPVDSQTCDDSAFMRLKKHNIYYAQNYYALVEELGWTVKREGWEKTDAPIENLKASYACQNIFKYVQDHSCYFVPYAESFHGKTSDQWQALIGQLYEDKDDNYFDEPELKGNWVTGEYMMKESWEWLSENAGHFFVLKILDASKALCQEEQWKKIAAKINTQSRKSSGMDSEYNNMRGNTLVMNYFNVLFDSENNDNWQRLARKYLPETDHESCTG